MKANELRIGNYLLNDVVFQVNPITLTMIIDKTWEFFQPIPLTEEWLLKFGFAHQYKNEIGQDFFECVIDSEFKLYVNLNRMNISISKKYVGNVYSKKIQYVHQLQNLYFAMTGEELIIGGQDE